MSFTVFIMVFSCDRKILQGLTMLHKLAVHIATIEIIIFGGHFSYYILLALLHDPIQTTLIYLIVAVCAFCLYILFFALSSCCFCIAYKKRNNCNDDAECKSLSLLSMAIYCPSILTVIVVLMMMIFGIQILTLGGHSLDSYLEFDHLILPLFLGLLSIALYKPTTKFVKSIVHTVEKEDSDGHDGNIDIEAGHKVELQSNETSE